MASSLRVDLISDAANTRQLLVNDLSRQAYASLYYSVNNGAGAITISDSSTYGVKMLFNKQGPVKNITPNLGAATWTHTYTGVYVIMCRYRQNSGADIWTAFAVTKNGNAEAVGISARTGSEDSHNERYEVMYTVDSTTATYQMQGWSLGTKTVTSSFGGGNPGWTNYATLSGGTTGDTGRMVDYQIYRLGDL